MNSQHIQPEHFQESYMLIYYACKLLKLLSCVIRHITLLKHIIIINENKKISLDAHLNTVNTVKRRTLLILVTIIKRFCNMGVPVNISK